MYLDSRLFYTYANDFLRMSLHNDQLWEYNSQRVTVFWDVFLFWRVAVHLLCVLKVTSGAKKNESTRMQQKVLFINDTEFILRLIFPFWMDYGFWNNELAMALQCVLWTSVSHYALNVKKLLMTAFYHSRSCDFFRYRRTSCLTAM